MEENSMLRLEIVGPEVEPQTVDAAAALAFASAYVALLQRVAKHERLPLTMTGLNILNKCVEFQIGFDDGAIGQQAAQQANVYLNASYPLPIHGLASAVGEVRKAISTMPKGYQCRVKVGLYVAELPRATARPVVTTREQISLRATPVLVGGANARKQTARFSAVSEQNGFTLDLVDQQMAALVGTVLHQAVDIEAVVRRDAWGRICEGELVAIRRLSNENPAAAFEAWFRENCAEWDNVDDVNAELGRE